MKSVKNGYVQLVVLEIIFINSYTFFFYLESKFNMRFKIEPFPETKKVPKEQNLKGAMLTFFI